jgi:hypothetical protein
MDFLRDHHLLSKARFLDSPDDSGPFFFAQGLKLGANDGFRLAAKILQGDFHPVMHVHYRIAVEHLG